MGTAKKWQRTPETRAVPGVGTVLFTGGKKPGLRLPLPTSRKRTTNIFQKNFLFQSKNA
jgi:hypothetical protein